MKFEDGRPITSKEIAYGIARSFDPDLTGGPTYIQEWLADTPQFDTKWDFKENKTSLPPGLTTPDDKTLRFEFAKPHCDLPFAVSLPTTAPLPAGQGHRRRPGQAAVLVRPVQDRQEPGRRPDHPGPQPQLGPEHRPGPPPVPGPVRLDLRPDRGRRQQPGDRRQRRRPERARPGTACPPRWSPRWPGTPALKSRTHPARPTPSANQLVDQQPAGHRPQGPPGAQLRHRPRGPDQGARRADRRRADDHADAAGHHRLPGVRRLPGRRQRQRRQGQGTARRQDARSWSSASPTTPPSSSRATQLKANLERAGFKITRAEHPGRRQARRDQEEGQPLGPLHRQLGGGLAQRRVDPAGALRRPHHQGRGQQQPVLLQRPDDQRRDGPDPRRCPRPSRARSGPSSTSGS